MNQGATSSFQTLPLNPATLEKLNQLGYLEMTPIHAATLPAALAGKDLIGWHCGRLPLYY